MEKIDIEELNQCINHLEITSITFNRRFRYWTRKEIDYLINNIDEKHIVHIANHLHRTKSAIKQKVKDLKKNGELKKKWN